ncbi:alpha/beta hydrolase [Candidatus Pelagadaptatus aseana]|uniref:alpha/beta hydrolase n=1 Tax=Candidatus Pelagadaptatus aseana TaxID=3120508 RepID=UPI003C6EB4C9
MLWFFGVLLLIVAVGAYLTWVVFPGEDLTAYDHDDGELFGRDETCDEHAAIVASIHMSRKSVASHNPKQRLQAMRDNMDAMSDGMTFESVITAVDAGGVSAEWVVAPGVDTSRRLLYIHGGAFSMGSPRSHRNITNKFSQTANAAVLAIDYRLMPEHGRHKGIEDCRNAYLWMLQHGPDGESVPSKVFVSGDSAGGNLTLMLLLWARDNGIRQADAAVALSPTTDATYSSPSIDANHISDPMLGHLFKKLAITPRPVVLWLSWLGQRVNPSSPLVSPVFADLSNLPPLLVQASMAEVLFDDAKRLVNKAVASGSPAKLQSWKHMVHVWHFFYPRLQESVEAWDEIGKFIAEQQ